MYIYAQRSKYFNLMYGLCNKRQMATNSCVEIFLFPVYVSTYSIYQNSIENELQNGRFTRYY